jgi:hypothetical protein
LFWEILICKGEYQVLKAISVTFVSQKSKDETHLDIDSRFDDNMDGNSAGRLQNSGKNNGVSEYFPFVSLLLWQQNQACGYGFCQKARGFYF